MHVWRKGIEFLSITEHKQHMLQREISQVQNHIEKIKTDIALHYNKYDRLVQDIKELTPAGLLTRSEIYEGIRQQGILLSHQQLLFHKINQLEEEQLAQEKILQNYRVAMTALDKKYYKMDQYIQKTRHAYFKNKENKMENDIQEVAYCVGKNH